MQCTEVVWLVSSILEKNVIPEKMWKQQKFLFLDFDHIEKGNELQSQKTSLVPGKS